MPLPLTLSPAEPAVSFVFFFDLLILSRSHHANLITLEAGGGLTAVRGRGGLCTRGTAPLLFIDILLLLEQEIQEGQPRLDVDAALSEPSNVGSLLVRTSTYIPVSPSRQQLTRISWR
jgi:hypothetical protein